MVYSRYFKQDFIMCDLKYLLFYNNRNPHGHDYRLGAGTYSVLYIVTVTSGLLRRKEKVICPVKGIARWKKAGIPTIKAFDRKFNSACSFLGQEVCGKPCPPAPYCGGIFVAGPQVQNGHNGPLLLS